MVIDRLLNRFTLIMTLLLVAVGLSACYKDAGDDMEPTSNRVDLSDIAPTTPATPTPMVTAMPTAQPFETMTRTLVPTTTPADFVPDEQPTAEPAESTLVEEPGAGPTSTLLFAPSFTPAITLMPTEPGITTPGMSDIQPSPTTTPTLDPAFQPTPTALPVEENPCIHVVRPNDTLYSIAQDNSVLLTDLVAANANLLGGNQNTPLQIGWQLQIPGCSVPGAEPTATSEAEADTGGEVTPTAVPQEGFPKTHTVQSGETIYSIGRLYGVDPQAIIDANNLVNPSLIRPGDTLVIPAPE
jgi:LysM repeat protein